MRNKFFQATIFSAVLLGVFNACKSESTEVITHITSPTGLNSSESSWHSSENGSIYLSWVEPETDGNYSQLKFSTLNTDDTWSVPKTIARGNDWFLNWADFPSMTSFGETNLVAHYLQKSASGTYTYDVMQAISNDNGNTWNPAFKAHKDNTNSEHGFVSKVALNDDSFLSVWLDGRQTAYAKQDSTIANQMTLRAGEFNTQGKLINDYLLDNRVCDCCQTDISMTEDGPIVVYRDRSDNEIRDIYYVRQVNGLWTEPQVLHNDNWIIQGCPVNGPAISANGKNVAVVWFSIANGIPAVKVAFSNNNGETFGKPIRIGDKEPMGRVDIELLNDNSALISWMDTVEDKTAIQLQRVSQDGSLSAVSTLTEASGSRSSGFPRMTTKDNKAYLSWTNVGDKETLSIKTAIINIDAIQ